jgi:hypothetical protein
VELAGRLDWLAALYRAEEEAVVAGQVASLEDAAEAVRLLST